MTLFKRSGGYYLFWTGFVYFCLGTYSIFVNNFISTSVLQILWIASLAFPFTYPPFGRWLNMSIDWDQKMFGKWFGKKEETPSNVVPFPEPKAVPKMPEVKPPKEDKPAHTYYRLGFTSDNRVSFQMGYSEITMNAEGIDNLIKQLEVFRDQIKEQDYDESSE